jgi:cytoskeletal protein RodZ
MAKKSRRKLYSRFSKKTLIIVLVILITLAGIVYAKHRNSSNENNPSGNTAATANKQSINYNPPTDQEKKDTEAHKQNLENPPPPPPTTSSGKVQVTPTITSYDSGKVYALVTGVFEEGGTCTATATKSGSQPVIGTSEGFGNSNYTSCTPISLSLPAGTWSLTVSYSSTKAEGKSEAKNITIH